MKKNNKVYLVLAILFLAVFSVGEIIPLIPNNSDNSGFLLPEQEESISLYDSTAYVTVQDLTQTLIRSGTLVAFETNTYELDYDTNPLPFVIGDYILSGDVLYGTTTVSYNGKILNVNYNDVTSICTVDILNLDKLIVQFQVEQSDIDSIHLDQDIIVRYNNHEYTGSISSLGSEFINGYLSVSGIFTYDNDDLQLRQGAAVSVSILIREKRDVLAIPKSAVYFLDGTAYVDELIITNSKETLVPTAIILGIEGDFYYEIISGISENTKIAF